MMDETNRSYSPVGGVGGARLPCLEAWTEGQHGTSIYGAALIC